MSSLQELQAQRATFIMAKKQGKITQAQLDTALASNQKQIDALKANQQTTATPTPTPAPSQVNTASPMPAESVPNQFTDQSGTTWVNTQPTTQSKTPEALQLIPTAMGPIPVKTFEAGAKDPTMQNVVIPGLEIAGIIGLSAIPGAAPVVLGGAVAGVGIDIGVKSVSKSFETGKAELVLPNSVREVTDTALLSAGLSAAGGAAIGGIAKVAPSLAGQSANALVKAGTRVAVNAGLGGGVSGVASGGDPTAILEGAAFGAGLGLVGEVAGPAASKASGLISKTGTGRAALNTVSNVKENIVGSKFTEITGAKEVVDQTTIGKQTTVTRVTQPETRTVTLRGKDAQFYKTNNLESMENPIIELSGKQRVNVIQQDAAGVGEQITTFPKSATKTPSSTKLDVVGDINKEFGGVIESVGGYKSSEMPLPDPTVVTTSRSAKPILETLKGGSKTFEKITVGSEVKVTTTKGRVYSDRPVLDLGTDKPVTVLEKTAIVKDGEFLPAGKSAFRQYDTVRIYDKPSNAADVFGKATGKSKTVAETPDLFNRVTGKVAEKTVKPSDTPPLVNKEQIGILKEQGKTQKIWDKAIVDKQGYLKREAGDLSGPMKAGSNDFFRKTANTSGSKTGKTEIVQTTKVTTEQNSALPRAIVGKAKPNLTTRGSAWTAPPTSSVNVWGRQRQTQDMEYDIVSTPKNSPLPTPKTITDMSITPRQRNRTGGGLVSVTTTTVQETPKTIVTPDNIIPVPKGSYDWTPKPLPISNPDTFKPTPQAPPTIIPTPDVTTIHIPDVTPTPIIIPDVRTSTTETPKITPDFIQTPKTTPKTTPIPKIPTMRKLGQPIIPFTRGGGDPSLLGSKKSRGVWGLRKQAIPTPKQLVKQSLGKSQVFKAKGLAITADKFFGKPKRKAGKKR